MTTSMLESRKIIPEQKTLHFHGTLLYIAHHFLLCSKGKTQASNLICASGVGLHKNTRIKRETLGSVRPKNQGKEKHQ